MVILAVGGTILYFLQSFWPWGGLLYLCVASLHVARWLNGKRIDRNLQKVNYEVCIVCGYSLKDLPEEHTCPECGYAFDKRRLSRLWKASLVGGSTVDPPEYKSDVSADRIHRVRPAIIGIPRQVWKHGFWALILGMASLLILFSTFFSRHAWQSRIIATSLFLLFGTATMYYMSCTRLNRKLRLINYEMCLVCGRSLTELPQASTCPDCGFVFDKKKLAEQWRYWLLGAVHW